MTKAGVSWHLIAQPFAGDFRIVATDGSLRNWLKLSNKLRRDELAAAIEVVGDCFRSGNVVARPGKGYAVPVAAAPGSAVGTVAVLYSAAAGALSADVPEFATWEWRVYQDGYPPALHATGTALEMLGIGARFRDRTAFGPADIWTRFSALDDIAEHAEFVFESEVGSWAVREPAVVADDGTRRSLNVAEIVTEVSGDRRVTALAWHGPATQTELLRRDLGLALARKIATVSGQYVAVMDTRFAVTPIVCAWVTEHPPGLGHGVSTGQTPGFHDEDLPRVFEYISMLSTLGPDDQVPTLEGVRLRWASGGFRSGRGQAFRLSPELSSTLWVVMGTVDLTGPVLTE